VTQKAIEFATICLGYKDAYTAPTMQGTAVYETDSDRRFNPDSITDLQRVLEEFLGNRYWIQLNRDLTGLFQWTAIVGQQGLIDKQANFEQGKGVGNIAEAVFDACVAARQMDKRDG
jgi:hypothetical protein